MSLLVSKLLRKISSSLYYSILKIMDDYIFSLIAHEAIESNFIQSIIVNRHLQILHFAKTIFQF